VLANYDRIRTALSGMDAHIHYSIKANGNLAVLRALAEAGAGFDAVSGGEVFRALKAGCPPERIVLAGVAKSPAELQYAVEQGVGWINVENAAECDLLNEIARTTGVTAQVALRLNPDVSAATHPHIATGHGSAKFGLTADVVRTLLSQRDKYPNLAISGLHVHIGSQLQNVSATCEAVECALELIAPYDDIHTLNIGGGLPVAYSMDETPPAPADFAEALKPLVNGYQILLEPGRAIVADAGVLLTRVLYIKHQGGVHYVSVDASMTELLRPALYQARHAVVPVHQTETPDSTFTVVGPVCETTDVLAQDVPLPEDTRPGDLLAILTTGAYGMVMASNYNARPRPPEIVINPDGQTWRIARRRETWDDLIALENL
jgi:diaminopimelate decarboxylase